MSVFNKKLEQKWLNSKKPGPADEDGIIQKRDHFRLACNLPTEFKLLVKDETGEVTPSGPNDGCVTNLSGGGLKLQTGFDMPEESRILISLRIYDETLYLVGEIRVKYNNPLAIHPFQYGVVFRGISDADRDKIYRYLFKEQPNRALMG